MEPDDSWPPPAEERKIQIFEDLGNLSFPIHSSNLVQQYFDQGFRFLAAFDFRRAVISFRAAQDADAASCGLCLWGEAMALGANLNSFDEPRLMASIPLAFQKAQEAQGVGKLRSSEIGSGLIHALQKRYLPTAAEYITNELQLTHSYALEMEKLLSRTNMADANYANLVALTADALMNTSPWDYWEAASNGSHGSQLRPTADRAMRMLHKALSINPRHAFCIHLLVHITEASGNLTLLEEVRPFAEILPQLIPGAPHLIHMTFHTLMHTGNFHRADGDNAWASKLPRQIYPMHNLDTLSWVCRIQGRSFCSLDAAKSLEHKALPLVGSDIFETGFPPARFAAVWPLTLLAFGRFKQILLEEPPVQCNLDPFLAGIWHFARGVAAHHDAHPSAWEELKLLGARRAEVARKMSLPAGLAWKNFNGSKVWAVYPAGQLLELAEAELRASLERNVDVWRRAWHLEAALPYDEPPAWYLPVANRFGEALAAQGQLDEAWSVYSASLSHLPKNGWAMMGLWQLCEKRWGHQNATCNQLHQNFSEAWKYADVVLKNSAEVLNPSASTLRVWDQPNLRVVAWLFVASVPLMVLWRMRGRHRPCACYYRLEGP